MIIIDSPVSKKNGRWICREREKKKKRRKKGEGEIKRPTQVYKNHNFYFYYYKKNYFLIHRSCCLSHHNHHHQHDQQQSIQQSVKRFKLFITDWWSHHCQQQQVPRHRAQPEIKREWWSLLSICVWLTDIFFLISRERERPCLIKHRRERERDRSTQSARPDGAQDLLVH